MSGMKMKTMKKMMNNYEMALPNYNKNIIFCICTDCNTESKYLTYILFAFICEYFVIK